MSGADLRTFLLQFCPSEDGAQEIMSAIEDALRRRRRGMPSRKDLSQRAGHLEATADKFVRAAKALMRDLEESENVWPYLRQSYRDPGGLSALQQSRLFDQQIGRRDDLISALRDLQCKVAGIRSEADRARRECAVTGNPVDESELAFGLELAGYWRLMTKQGPTVSGEASFDEPRTNFARFVCLSFRHDGIEEFEGDFAHFLKSVKSRSEDGALKARANRKLPHSTDV
jgi:hypothetical protein